MSLTKTLTATGRAGFSVERISRMSDQGVSDAVIALQMTENSRNGIAYTAKDVRTVCNIFNDCKTAPLVTAKQTRALIDEQELCISGAQPV